MRGGDVFTCSCKPWVQGLELQGLCVSGFGRDGHPEGMSLSLSLYSVPDLASKTYLKGNNLSFRGGGEKVLLFLSLPGPEGCHQSGDWGKKMLREL